MPPYPTLGEASKRAAGSYFTDTLFGPRTRWLVRSWLVASAGMVSTTMARPRIVIVGAGFGGLSAAHGLAGADADVTVIDRRNYHLFQPLLYQVATAGLSPAQIAQPIRAILRNAPNVRVMLGQVAGVDKPAPHRDGSRTARSPTTIWSLATGARHAYFGHDDGRAWRPA